MVQISVPFNWTCGQAPPSPPLPLEPPELLLPTEPLELLELLAPLELLPPPDPELLLLPPDPLETPLVPELLELPAPVAPLELPLPPDPLELLLPPEPLEPLLPPEPDALPLEPVDPPVPPKPPVLPVPPGELHAPSHSGRSPKTRHRWAEHHRLTFFIVGSSARPATGIRALPSGGRIVPNGRRSAIGQLAYWTPRITPVCAAGVGRECKTDRAIKCIRGCP
jgi:hypothetical protein